LTATLPEQPFEAEQNLAAIFWNEVAKHIRGWGLAKERKVSAADLRRDDIHAHTLALAQAGCDLIRKHPRDGKQKRVPRKSLDWSRGNARVSEGRAMNARRLSKRNINARLTANAITPGAGTVGRGRSRSRYLLHQ
jgi:DNA sulfur modification protein DndB